MSAQTRRGLLGGAAALATVPAALAAAQPDPDAELIRLCAEHIDNLAAFNASPLDSEDCPFWFAYLRTRDAISAAQPMMIEGMQAKARAALADGHGGSGDNWAWDLVNDLAGSAVA